MLRSIMLISLLRKIGISRDRSPLAMVSRCPLARWIASQMDQIFSQLKSTPKSTVKLITP